MFSLEIRIAVFCLKDNNIKPLPFFTVYFDSRQVTKIPGEDKPNCVLKKKIALHHCKAAHVTWKISLVFLLQDGIGENYPMSVILAFIQQFEKNFQ